MTSGYILIAAIFILGGLIAALGDRLGTKIGKARLRLFNLRPRQTAMIITFLTGILIAASTLGILFGLSRSLRQGVFQLDDILRELRHTKRELFEANQRKKEIEKQLSTVQTQQANARAELDAINLNFQQSKKQLKTISERAAKLRSELNILLDERQNQLQQLEELEGQSQQLQSQLQQREQEIISQDRVLEQKEASLQQLAEQRQILQKEIKRRDQSISSLDTEIAAKNRELQGRTERLQNLQSQLKFLEREVENLERYYQTYIQELRERRIAIVKGQVLASAVVRIIDPDAAVSAVDSLLRQANDNAIEAVLLPENQSEQRVVKITKAEVEQLATQLKDGQDYVLRIISAANYVQGEKDIRVFADLALNKKIFAANEEIATVSIDADDLTRADLQERLDWLLAVSKFRAQRAGVLGDLQVGDARVSTQVATLVNFIDKISNLPEPIDRIQAVVAEPTYTAGPLKLKLIGIRKGEVVFGT